MDELDISGKRYISTRRAAREHGYHSDYMGQLIRGGKVAGQKVGRAWYIDEESLALYLGKEQTYPVPQAQAAEPSPVVPAEVKKESEPAPAEIIKEEPVQEIEHTETQEVAVPEVTAEEEKATPVLIKKEMPAEVAEEEKGTPVPIHIPAEAIREIGGLRYVADDSPSLPTIVRMPQQSVHAKKVETQARSRPEGRSFPFVGLSVVGVLALLAAGFASNFVSATIVSEPGKAATVEYAIHW